MSRTVGTIAFIAGLGVGALTAVLTDRFIPQPQTDPFDNEGFEGRACGYVPHEDDEDNVTAEDLNDDSSDLVNSLEGITVSGQDAVLLKIRVLDVERAKLLAMWGTKGLDGDEPTTFRRLVDLETTHLINIRDKSSRVSEDELVIINSILEDRVAAGDEDESVLDD